MCAPAWQPFALIPHLFRPSQAQWAECASERLLQTFQPEASGDPGPLWAAMKRASGAQRPRSARPAFMPPFARLAGVILSAREARLVCEAGQALARADGPLAEIGAQVFGPAPAPIARVRGRHRVRLLVRAPRAAPLQAALRRWVAAAPPPGPVRLQLDIDPQSFL
jgi:Primosomal protein N'' (replication factor Y) - superfamily II helicase